MPEMTTEGIIEGLDETLKKLDEAAASGEESWVDLIKKSPYYKTKKEKPCSN